MDLKKVNLTSEWHIWIHTKRMQTSVGFANFYRKYIKLSHMKLNCDVGDQIKSALEEWCYLLQGTAHANLYQLGSYKNFDFSALPNGYKPVKLIFSRFVFHIS